MADLYNSQYLQQRPGATRDQHQHHQQPQQPAYPPHSSSYNSSSLVYGLPPPPALEENLSASTTPDPSKSPSDTPKIESKPQATFLTKLYALLERPEYQTMIRWDNNGEQIIVERPEQLALHVLPSIYRQSRFASFSRQLNIYGFMRKVNLRNVDPAIDDPDASTWSHPTLNRSSPPDVVANFKRRVPPRLPKQRKRSDAELDSIQIPSSSLGGGIGLPTLPMGMVGSNNNRPRGLSAPSGGPFGLNPNGGGGGGFHTPQSATFPSQSTAKWGPPSNTSPNSGYQRNLPPLAIPNVVGPAAYSSGPSTYGGGGVMSGVSPADDFGHHHHHQHPHSAYPSSVREPMFAYGGSSSSYGGGSHHHNTNWSSNPSASSYGLPPPSSLASSSNTSPTHVTSLSSLLNPSNNSSSSAYSQRPSNAFPQSNNYPSLSPDSRPGTGYSGGGYEMDDSSRPITPSTGPSRNMRHQRPRRRSEAQNPYPTPSYYGASGNGASTELRPVTAPSYDMNQNDEWSRSLRPSTSTSSMSNASVSTGVIHTPPILEEGHQQQQQQQASSGLDSWHEARVSQSDSPYFMNNSNPPSDPINNNNTNSSTTSLNGGGNNDSSYLKLEDVMVGLKPGDIDFGNPLKEEGVVVPPAGI